MALDEMLVSQFMQQYKIKCHYYKCPRNVQISKIRQEMIHFDENNLNTQNQAADLRASLKQVMPSCLSAT
jgi:hypothetical protein